MKIAQIFLLALVPPRARNPVFGAHPIPSRPNWIPSPPQAVVAGSVSVGTETLPRHYLAALLFDFLEVGVDDIVPLPFRRAIALGVGVPIFSGRLGLLLAVTRGARIHLLGELVR